MTAPSAMTVFIPLTLRQRNGRPKIIPPAETERVRIGSPHVLRAIARAWSWRRKLEDGEASTIFDIAHGEGVTDRFVSRMIRLAYLSPAVLEQLIVARRSPALSIKDLIGAADLPWHDQERVVFG